MNYEKNLKYCFFIVSYVYSDENEEVVHPHRFISKIHDAYSEKACYNKT